VEAGGEDLKEDFQHSKHIENSQLINILQNEFGEKNKTIQALIQSNQSLIQAMTAEKINDAARLMIQDKSHRNTGSETTEQPSGFFSRIFRKK
jgi:hypothetical protein